MTYATAMATKTQSSCVPPAVTASKRGKPADASNTAEHTRMPANAPKAAEVYSTILAGLRML